MCLHLLCSCKRPGGPATWPPPHTEKLDGPQKVWWTMPTEVAETDSIRPYDPVDPANLGPIVRNSGWGKGPFRGSARTRVRSTVRAFAPKWPVPQPETMYVRPVLCWIDRDRLSGRTHPDRFRGFDPTKQRGDDERGDDFCVHFWAPACRRHRTNKEGRCPSPKIQENFL